MSSLGWVVIDGVFTLNGPGNGINLKLNNGGGLGVSSGNGTALYASDGGAYFIEGPGTLMVNSASLLFGVGGTPDTRISRIASGTLVLDQDGGSSPGAIYGGTTLTLGVSGTTGTWVLGVQGQLSPASSAYRITWPSSGNAGSSFGVLNVTRSVAVNAVASTNFVSFSVPASDGSFLIGGNINITTLGSGSFQLQVGYTDETNTARTTNMLLINPTGSASAFTANGSGPWAAIPMEIRAKASTTITLSTVGTFTTCTYNVEGSITQIS